MVYEYFPSRGDESESNNMIRQWMATIALIRVAGRTEDAQLYDRIADNIDYNLAISYSTDGDLGLIADPDGDVKLGAIALAALAISQHPDRDRWAAEEAALRRTVDHLWQADGSFVTFYVPADRNDNQNFYPGEALLLWAVTLEDGDRCRPARSVHAQLRVLPRLASGAAEPGLRPLALDGVRDGLAADGR